MVQYISKQRKGAVEMTSPDLKLNLPKRDHQKDTRSGVYVTPVKKCVKATAQSQQDATQIRKKVATVPLEIMEELVRDVGELRDMPTGNVVVQGRSEKNMKADVCPTGGHHNILRFDKGYCGCVPAVSLPITNTAVMLRVVEKYKEVKHTGVEYLPALQSSWNMAEELCHGLHCACALQEVYATSDMVEKTMLEKREQDIAAVLKDNSVYEDDESEEVLAEQRMMLEGLSSYHLQKKYEVAEWRSRYKEHSKKAGSEKNMMKKKKSWQMQTSRIYQLPV